MFHRERTWIVCGMLSLLVVGLLAPGPIEGYYREPSWLSLTPGAEATYLFKNGKVSSTRGTITFDMGIYQKRGSHWVWQLGNDVEIRIIPKLLFAIEREQDGRLCFLGFRIPRSHKRAITFHEDGQRAE